MSDTREQFSQVQRVEQHERSGSQESGTRESLFNDAYNVSPTSNQRGRSGDTSEGRSNGCSDFQRSNMMMGMFNGTSRGDKVAQTLAATMLSFDRNGDSELSFGELMDAARSGCLGESQQRALSLVEQNFETISNLSIDDTPLRRSDDFISLRDFIALRDREKPQDIGDFKEDRLFGKRVTRLYNDIEQQNSGAQ